MRAEVATGCTSPIVNQMPTPEIAPNTVETRISMSELRFASARNAGFRRLTARVSTSAIVKPPPIAKWETRTWAIATIPISTPPPNPRSQIG